MKMRIRSRDPQFIIRGDNAARPSPTYTWPAKCGLGWPTMHLQYKLKSLARPHNCRPAGPRANPFFLLNLMIRLSMFNKLENFKKFTKLGKDFGELDDKLIIQYFHHIHICTLNVFFKF